MAKFVKDEKEPVVVLQMNSKAFGLVRNLDGTQGWSLVTLNFDAKSETAKVSEVKKVSDSREEAEYYFKVACGHMFMDLK